MSAPEIDLLRNWVPSRCRAARLPSSAAIGKERNRRRIRKIASRVVQRGRFGVILCRGHGGRDPPGIIRWQQRVEKDEQDRHKNSPRRSSVFDGHRRFASNPSDCDQSLHDYSVCQGARNRPRSGAGCSDAPGRYRSDHPRLSPQTEVGRRTLRLCADAEGVPPGGYLVRVPCIIRARNGRAAAPQAMADARETQYSAAGTWTSAARCRANI